jgi:Domain of unknown function (DUF4262)
VTRSLEDDAKISAADAKVLTNIKTHGWHVAGIFRAEDELEPEWAFSIGLFHSFSHPELIVFGLKLQICMGIVSKIGQQVKMGKCYQDSAEYEGVLGDSYKCCFPPKARALS